MLGRSGYLMRATFRAWSDKPDPPKERWRNDISMVWTYAERAKARAAIGVQRCCQDRTVRQLADRTLKYHKAARISPGGHLIDAEHPDAGAAVVSKVSPSQAVQKTMIYQKAGI